MMRIVLATACCRYGSGGLVIKFNFCSDFEHKVWSLFWSWSSGKIWSRSLFSILLLMFCKGNEVESWSRFWIQVWSISWILSLVRMLMFADFEILKLMLCQYSEDKIWSNFVFELVIWLKQVTLVNRTQPSGPFCLWQCLYFVFVSVSTTMAGACVSYKATRVHCPFCQTASTTGWLVEQTLVSKPELESVLCPLTLLQVLHTSWFCFGHVGCWCLW